jgi:hypothetical protein
MRAQVKGCEFRVRANVCKLLNMKEVQYLNELNQQVLLVHEEAGKKKGEELIIPASSFIICDSASLPPSIVTSVAPSPQGSASVSPTSHSNSHSPALYKLPLSVLPDFDPEVEEDGSFSCASVLCVPARKRAHPAGGATFSSTVSLVKSH